MTRLTRALPTECPVCLGLGYTRETQAEMQTEFQRGAGYVEIRTIQQGSGCPRCHGTGQIGFIFTACFPTR